LAARQHFADSPWFWAYLFASAALIALALIGAKYEARQSQIEHQFEGRQQIVQGHAEQDREATPADRAGRITLQPLFFALALVTIFVWLIHWRTMRANQNALKSKD
jgi:hypothetical protein